MSVAAFPSTNRKTYIAPVNTWDLNAGALYSFKVVLASPDGQAIRVANYPGFTEFVLPINPSSLSVSVPFATSLIATSGGILEENNGTIFRTITISGTLGVSGRKAFPSPLPGPSSVQDLRSLGPSIGAPVVQSGPLVQLVSGISASDLPELGHSKINDLLNYFVAYTEMKKGSSNPLGSVLGGGVVEVTPKNARMLFVNRKDGVTYVVTPLQFDTVKDAGDPHLTKYRVTLKAWDIASDIGLIESNLPAFPIDIQAAGKAAIEQLNNARGVMADAQDVLRAAVGDLDSVVAAINSVTLFAKDLTSVPATLADLFGSNTGILFEKFRDIDQARALLAAAIANPNSGDFHSSLNSQVFIQSLTQFLALATDPTNPSGRSSMAASTITNKINQQTRDAANPLRTPEQQLALLGVLSTISLSSITFTNAEQAAITSSFNTARQLNIATLDNYRAIIEEARDTFSDHIGVGNSTTDSILGHIPAPQARTATPEDYVILNSFNSSIAAIDAMGATMDVTRARIPDPFVRAQNAAPNLGIGDYSSGFAVPFPLNGTLEQLAANYLGSPDRWIDIAIANGLKPPYVDEAGFTVAFAENGSGNQITLVSGANLVVGQEVFLQSSAIPPQKYHIIGVQPLASGTTLVTLDNTTSLSNFLVGQGATLSAHLPGTINSSKMIVIPVANVPVNNQVPNAKKLPIFAALDRQQQAMGIDLALGPNFDLILDHNDFKLLGGAQNALQAILLKVSYEKGSIPRHPEIGLGLQIGTRQTNDADSVRQALENAILGDDRFSDISGLQVSFAGDAVSLTVRVKAADGSDIIPLTFTIKPA